MNATQNTNTHPTHRPRFARAFFAASFAAGTVFAMGGSATAAHPMDDGPGTQATTTQRTQTSPCFAGRTPDRWPADAGPQPRCVHASFTTK